MIRPLHRFLTASLALVSSAFSADPPSYDVVIYGGTSAGIAAAIQTARMGKTAVLIEPTAFLGGLTTGGLGATDIGNKKAIGGISREFYQHVFRYYNNPAKWQQQTREDYFAKKHHGNSGAEDSMWTFEPHAASEIYDEMLAAVKNQVTIVLGERLNRETGVTKEGGRITAITMESGRRFQGAMFLDCGYEGDLMAAAGVRYHVGREANAKYGETLNGIQTRHARSHQFSHDVDPYLVKGDPSSGLLPGIDPEGPGEEFAGDHRVQAYNFRMCTTDVPENRRDWEKPANYDERWFEMALRAIEAGDHRISWAPSWMPNRKTDTNNKHAISTDFIGQNWAYPEADYATREKIWKAHEDWQKGLIWTYAHHPRVPEEIRLQYQNLGLAKDEFTDNDNWPRQLYIREARRMVSDYVMTEKNCKRQEIVEDSVGMGAYNMDSHNVQRYVTPEGFVRNEGDVQVGSRPYPISFRSIRPRRAECENLLTPTCLSASHIAFGSIRMEPVFMVLGQSCATAAVQAIEQDVAIQDIDAARLKQRLLDDGQVLDFESPPAPNVTRYTKAEIGGIVIDDDEARLKGFDTTGHTTPGFVGDVYRHDGDASKGAQSARFVPDLPETATYQVAITYSALSNRASNVPVTIHHAKGEEVIHVDQTKKPQEDKNLQPLGTFLFEKGTDGWVEISNLGTQGHVIIDAVRFFKVE
ncbi:MAG: FAD-dependent oxidoreductase [Verrucomicrobiales bacterium]|nr:FAD-dependent oxidoreductase [Verrucomicrobiales bacterium]